MIIRKFHPGIINEFDSLEDLRKFDKSYIDDTRSKVIDEICRKLNCKQRDIVNIKKDKSSVFKYCFEFSVGGINYEYVSSNLFYSGKLSNN